MKLIDLLKQNIISNEIQVVLYDKDKGLVVFGEVAAIEKTCRAEVLEAEITLLDVEKDDLIITIDYVF